MPFSCTLKNDYDYKALEGLILKLKLQYFGHLMRTANSLEKTLMLGKTEGRRRRQRAESHVCFNMKFLRVLYGNQKAPLWFLK